MRHALSMLTGFSVAAVAYACGGETVNTLPPTGQIILYVSTDAPLPPPEGVTLGPDDAPPLFDRLRIEIFAPNEKVPCRDCTREFPLDRDLVKTGSVSFGFVPPPNVAGYAARLQLYRAIALRQGAPMPTGVITRVVSLPKVAAEGVTPIGVTLRVDEVGVPKGSLDAPTVAEDGKPDFNLVGTWPGAIRTKCKTAAKPGEVCVPGGAFWMGDPTRGAQTPQFEAGIPRLVVLSPFFIDAVEVTVASFRASNLARLDPDLKTSEDPYEAENRGRPSEFDADVFGACTFTQKPGTQRAVSRYQYDRCGVRGEKRFIPGTTQGDPPVLVSVDPDPVTEEEYTSSLTNRNTDDLPVNCISWAKSAQYCRSLGKDLPTEAQIEYLAGGLSSHRYPWGNEDPTCEDAVFGRSQAVGAQCRPWGTLGQPLPAGSGKLDRIKLEGGEILDIAGNVSETVRDTWNRPTESCWSPPLLRDPVCAKATVDDAEVSDCAPRTEEFWGATPLQTHSPYTAKVGNWQDTPFNLWAAQRQLQFPYRRSVALGFRCERDDK